MLKSARHKKREISFKFLRKYTLEKPSPIHHGKGDPCDINFFFLSDCFLDKFIKIASENPFLWTGMKDASAESRKNLKQMLKRVQHDIRVRVSFFCHPEPGPELDSGSIDFGISVLGFKNLGFKAPSCGRGSLLG